MPAKLQDRRGDELDLAEFSKKSSWAGGKAFGSRASTLGTWAGTTYTSSFLESSVLFNKTESQCTLIECRCIIETESFSITILNIDLHVSELPLCFEVPL